MGRRNSASLNRVTSARRRSRSASLSATYARSSDMRSSLAWAPGLVRWRYVIRHRLTEDGAPDRRGAWPSLCRHVLTDRPWLPQTLQRAALSLGARPVRGSATRSQPVSAGGGRGALGRG